MKSVMISIGLVGLVLIFLLAGCTQQPPSSASPNGYGAPSGVSPSPSMSSSGRAVFTIADKAANMDAVSSVVISVNSVQVHGEGRGWVTVSSTPMTFDLLKLKASGAQTLVADANLSNDSYDQVRLEVSQVTVTDTSGIHNAKLPSGDLHIDGNFNVNPSSASVVEFDFITDQSLHVTGNGGYILAPVIHLQTQENATVDDSDQSNVKVSNGNVRTDVQVGMDENGTIGVGVSIPAGADIEIDNAGVIHVMAPAMNESMNSSVSVGNGRVVIGVKDKAADMSAVTNLNVTVTGVMAHSITTGGWVALSSSTETFDLLRLNASNEEALLTDVNLTNDSFDQLRLEISDVAVTDSSGTHEAKLPSGDIKIDGAFDVTPNSTSAVTFDFLADQSLHVTGNSQYIMAPVIHLWTEDNATVDDSDQSNVTVSGGTIKTDVQVGMDQNGNVGVGLGIPGNADISVDSNGMVHVNNGQGGDNVNGNGSIGSNMG